MTYNEVQRLEKPQKLKKRCPTCRIWLSADAFTKNKGNPDGLDTYCRPCKCAYARERRARGSNPTPRGFLRTPSPTATPTTANLHWAAGFLEGEGSFTGRKGRSVQVSAKQVNREPLEWMSALFGGAISLNDPSPGPYNTQPVHSWYATGVRGNGVALTLYPLLSKRRQTQIRKAVAAWKK